MRRNWIKLYVDQCLRGTMISELSASQRWIWIGLLLMAGDSNQEGLIFLRKDENGKYVGYSEATIAELLGVEEEEFISAMNKMIIHEKISVDKNNVIKILKWNKYQSEYQRQKPYRSPEGQNFLRKDSDKKNSNFNCNEGITLEEDRELDIDRELEKDTEILNLLQKVKNYPFDKEKDSELIKGLKAEFPDVDVLEKVKQICANWLDLPLLKKSRPRVQIRKWVSNERKWQKEAQVQKKVGQSRPEDTLPIPYKLWQKVALKLFDDGYTETKVAQFNYKATRIYPQIKPQWEQSDKTPETFIRLVEGIT